MDNIQIDPSQGAHAAAAVPDDMLEYLFRAVVLEMAVRMSREDFEQCLRHTLEARNEMEGLIDRVRRQRDLMQFAAEVRRDLAALPVAARRSEPTTGMYL